MTMAPPKTSTQNANDAGHYTATVRLALEGDVSPGDLEQLATVVAQTLNDDCAERVAAVSVSGAYDPATLEIGLDLAASGPSDVQSQITAVLRSIEPHGLGIENADTHFERAPALT
jgi:hypothetical protein